VTVSQVAGVPYRELDSFFHGPGWSVREGWVEEVAEFLSGPEWVIEWQGERVRPMVNERADVLLWLDHPRWLVLWRVVRRSIRRYASGAELWEGNREPAPWRVFTDREHIIRASWKFHPVMRKHVTDLVGTGAHPQLTVVRLRGQREVDTWLKGPLADAIAVAGEAAAD
jgi:adenylate kinase family enzyme